MTTYDRRARKLRSKGFSVIRCAGNVILVSHDLPFKVYDQWARRDQNGRYQAKLHDWSLDAVVELSRC